MERIRLQFLLKNKIMLFILIGLGSICILLNTVLINPEEKIKKYIENNKYSQAVELYNNYFFNTNNEEKYNRLFNNYINNIVKEWSDNKKDYEKTVINLEQFSEISNEEILERIKQQINTILIEGKGEDYLLSAKSAYENTYYIDAMYLVNQISRDYSNYNEAQNLYFSSKDNILLSVSNPNSKNDYEKYISILKQYIDKVEEITFEVRKNELIEELKVFDKVNEIVNIASELYDKKKYKESFVTLSFGLEEYPNNSMLTNKIVDFYNHYIISVTKEVSLLCKGEKYKEALEIINRSIEEYNCEEFNLLKESVKEQSSFLYRFKNSIKDKFEVLAQGWDKEEISVKKLAGETGNYVIKSGKKLLLGDYDQDSVTILSFSGNMIASLAGVDFLFDARDLMYDVTHWGDDEYFLMHLTTDVIALIPVVGAIKYLEHFKNLDISSKSTSDIVDSIKDVGKNSDDITKNIDTLISIDKNGTKLSDAIDTVVDNTKVVDKIRNEVKNGYELLFTNNMKLLGKTHEKTNVEFVLSQVKLSDGRKIAGVFPKFDSLANIQLTEDLYKASFKEQQKYCLEQLKWKTLPIIGKYRKNFSEEQLEMIKNDILPSGYTWHHNEKEGLMQLVDTMVHQETNHTGGMSIWGIGY